MASLIRSPSPTGDASPSGSPSQLTPRSKLRAELAALDDSSDEDAAPVDRDLVFKPIAISTSKNNEPAHMDGSDVQDQEEDDEDEDIIRPRGRLAARMLATGSDKSIDDSATTHLDSGAEQTSTQHSDADTEEGGNALLRRRRIRSARDVTPEPQVTTSMDHSPASTGLFVSPNQSQHSDAGSASEDELPASIAQSARFKALVARKREERLAKEAEEKRKRAQRVELSDDEDEDDVSDISDDDGGRKLTQEVSSRPSVRKASKKALEEMNRETQRLSRSMQLVHEAKTKKKISKSSLFERFNFRIPAAEVAPPQAIQATSSSRPGTPGSAGHTDIEMVDKDTPPSSPPSVLKNVADDLVPVSTDNQAQADTQETGQDEELPSLDAMVTEATKPDKGKDIATPKDLASPKRETPLKTKRQLRVKLPSMQTNLATIDLDEELLVAKPKKPSKLDAIFSRVPSQQNKAGPSIPARHQLAHLSSPPQDTRKKYQKPSMTVGELQLSLQQRARAQAKLERDRRMEMLKAKGIHVQTEEEREKEREEVEDIVARARQEAEEIMARERVDAKKAKEERKANGQEDHLDWDDSDDDDSFVGSDEENLEPIEEGDIEFSGSEDEEDAYGAVDNDEDVPAGHPMFDEVADEDEDSGEDDDQVTHMEDDAEDEDAEELNVVQPTTSKSRRGKKHVQILSDDEEEVTVEATPKPKRLFHQSPSKANSDSPVVPTSVLRSATKTFIPGLPVPAAGPAGMGLTQIFAGTMDDSQAGSLPPATGSPMQFRPSFEDFPDSQFSATAGESQPGNMILDSQTETQKRGTQTQGIQLNFEQSQLHGFDSLMHLDGTQASDVLEPTQDGGFGEFTPLKRRFIDPPQGTIDTVILNGTPAADVDMDAEPMESPLVRKRGKLRRRGEVSFAESTLPPTEIPGSPLASATASVQSAERTESTVDDEASAFKLMAKAARRRRRALEKFNKKKSKAKEMVHGEAEESEDEYAGLGGADGEDSSEADEDDLAELRKQMIDDESKGLTEEEESKLAAFFADREREADSAQVDKLFRDITTGMLRKRRRGGAGGGNGDFDLSDSDDGGEARRRLKRKQFAKMQKALFADERIGKIAENPRNAAFMKSIEDFGSDEDMDFDEPYFVPEEESQNPTEIQARQGEAGQQVGEDSIPDSQPTAPNANLGRKRTRNDPSEPDTRPPPNLRRVRDGAKPASLAEVRRSLSSLLGEPNMSSGSIIPATDPNGSDDEGEPGPTSEGPVLSDKENRRPGSVSVVDRISLKRSGSSNLSASSKLAFAAPASTSGGGTFKVPALLRRATTNSLMSQSSNLSSAPSSTGVAVGASSMAAPGKSSGAFGDEGKLKKNAGKRSGVNFFARENERREKLKESERRREEKKWKGVEGRSKAVGGLFGGGQFE